MVRHYKRTGISPYKPPSYLPMVVPKQPRKHTYYTPNFTYRDVPNGKKKYHKPYFGKPQKYGSYNKGGVYLGIASKERVVWNDDWTVFIFYGLLIVCFFLSVLGHSINPVDLFFGDGNGTGGLLNMVSDFGTGFISFFTDSINTFKEWGLLGSPDGILNLIGALLTIITFIINVLLQVLILIVRILVYIFTGGSIII